MNFTQVRKARLSGLRQISLRFFVLAATVTVSAISVHYSAANTGMGTDWDKRSPEIHWPTGHTPNDADLFAHNELLIKSPCPKVWRHIVEAPKWPEWYPNAHDVRIVKGRTDVLEENSRFEWNTFGLQIDSTVHEFVPETRIGWFGKGKDIDAYHTWFLASTPEGCQVITEEVAIGPGAIAFRKSDPDAMHKGHDLWLSSLKQIAIYAPYGIGHNEAALPSASDTKSYPLIVEKDEGEHRVRRPRDLPMPTPYFTIKVDRQNGGSQKMWLVAEEIPSGGVIARHKHLDQDEILLIQSGSGHAWLGTEERDVHSGAVIFIPSNTWVGFENTGKEIVKVAAVFSDPGYDDFMRCSSVPQGGQPEPITPEELQACQHKGHVVAEGTFDSTTPIQTRPK